MASLLVPLQLGPARDYEIVDPGWRAGHKVAKAVWGLFLAWGAAIITSYLR